MRLRRCLIPLLLAVAVHAEDAPLQVRPLTNPAAAGAGTPQLATASDGTVWMAWVEPLADGGHRLVCADFDATRTSWGSPREIARGDNWFINWADTPQLSAGAGGRLAAVWFVNHPAGTHDHAAHHGGYGAWFSLSTDRGASWSAPAPLSSESRYNEFVSVAPLFDGRWLAVWLDGRAKQEAAGAAMRLYGRVLDSPGPDELVDERVCDCCPTTLATLPDGSAYAMYRDRSEEEVRDLGGARWRDGHWSLVRGLPADGWKIAGCPVNGPMLARRGVRLGLAWFTAAEGAPRVMSATSTDFALQWTMPRPIDREVPPLGRVGAAYLPDGSLWTSWLDQDGAVALTRLGPNGDVSGRHVVTAGSSASATRAGGIPRLAVVERGDAAPHLLLARTETAEGAPSRVTTHLISLPASAARAASGAQLADDCGCDRKGAGTEGHAVQGRVVRLLPERQSVLVAHEAVPGVMAAMTMAFKVDARLLDYLKPDQLVTGRMARREDGHWWLFNVRITRQPQ